MLLPKKAMLRGKSLGQRMGQTQKPCRSESQNEARGLEKMHNMLFAKIRTMHPRVRSMIVREYFVRGGPTSSSTYARSAMFEKVFSTEMP